MQPTLVIRNMAPGTSDAAIRQLFETYGTVTHVTRLPNDSNSAQVGMTNQAEAFTAVRALHNTNFQGNVVTVVIGGRVRDPLP